MQLLVLNHYIRAIQEKKTQIKNTKQMEYIKYRHEENIDMRPNYIDVIKQVRINIPPRGQNAAGS